MDVVTKAVKDLVKEQGLLETAKFLGESSTRNLENWIKSKNGIPKDKRGIIERILKLEGKLQ